jgi:hypothetical protein
VIPTYPEASFSEPLYTINTEETVDSYTGQQTRKIKPRYGVAYLITADARFNHSAHYLTNLIDEIDDGTALILIQIDQKYPILQKQTIEWLKARYDGSWKSQRQLSMKSIFSISSKTGRATRDIRGSTNARNVFMAKHMYKVIEGSHQLLFSNLAGYFELLDIQRGVTNGSEQREGLGTQWTHVINLSVQDYPMRTSRVIFDWLGHFGGEGQGYIGNSMIEHQFDAALSQKVMIPYLPIHSSQNQSINKVTPVHSTGYFITLPFQGDAHRTQRAWHILANEAVQLIRWDWRSLEYLAAAEFTFKPDEWFFATALYNNPSYKPFIINDCKRFLGFSWASHDVQWISQDWIHRFREEPVGKEPAYFFLRRVETVSDAGRELVNWIQRKHIQKHNSSWWPKWMLKLF